jgi:hypothetical protein
MSFRTQIMLRGDDETGDQRLQGHDFDNASNAPADLNAPDIFNEIAVLLR